MKKSFICILFICILLVSFCLSICYFVKNNKLPIIESNTLIDSTDGQIMKNDFKLLINGKEILLDFPLTYNNDKQYVNLPLIKIVKTLGGDVDWRSSKKVIIILNDTKFILNPAKKILKKEGDSFNIIDLPPGTTHGGYSQIVDEEFIVDSDSLHYFFYSLNIDVLIDFDLGVINIEKQSVEKQSHLSGDGLIDS